MKAGRKKAARWQTALQHGFLASAKPGSSDSKLVRAAEPHSGVYIPVSTMCLARTVLAWDLQRAGVHMALPTDHHNFKTQQKKVCTDLKEKNQVGFHKPYKVTKHSCSAVMLQLQLNPG